MNLSIAELKQEFIKTFGGTEEGLRVFSSPGRVNLIGEHTDYSGGYVFPAALTFCTTVVARVREDGKLRLKATDLPDMVEGTLDTIDNFKDLGWGNYQFGIFVELKKAGYNLVGADMLFHDTTPHGAGLSSSAAIEVSTAIAMATLGGATEIDNIEMAKLSQLAEHNYVGVKCGIMDQFASAMGKENHAIFLDCKTLDYQLVPMEIDGYKLILSNTKKKHSLGASKYNERRNECETGFAILKEKLPNATCLGEITPEEFYPVADAIENETVRRRVTHVIEEDARVKKSIEVLTKGDLETFGALMTASHVSLRDLYEVSCEELDILQAEALKIDGVLGSRMTGAGFGGCTVSLVKNESVDTFIEQVGKKYLEAVGHEAEFYITEIGNGGREIVE
ncbi:MAG: galactokinase [Clostridia bacterium]|nr:galactokinase [Clostridia bacterium]